MRLLLALALVMSTRGQIPRPCATERHLASRTCCPLWGLSDPSSPSPPPLDFRLGWPAYFFGRLCACAPGYGGFDCGECAHGLRGPRCQHRHLVERRDLRQLLPTELGLFLDRLVLAKRARSPRYLIYTSASPRPGAPRRFRHASLYHVFTWAHYLCAKRRGDGAPGAYAHGGPAFPLWHRLYLLAFEREMRNLTGDPDLSVPYWTWAGQAACDVCTDNIFGSSNARGLLNPSSRFFSWPTFCSGEGAHELDFSMVCPPGATRLIRRRPGWDPNLGGLPSLEDVRSCLRLPTYDSPPYNQSALGSFRNALEGYLKPTDPNTLYPSMHNMVHYYCGGTMSSVTYSANDPLFLSHHSYIDKIFELWLRAHPGKASLYPQDPSIPHGHRADDRMPPFILVVLNRDFMRSSLDFGYTYSNMTV
uniref:tyrosinase-like n=1 Tax=Pristiophorus japonicus TaxID=55135 RepID=UPI00398E9130